MSLTCLRAQDAAIPIANPTATVCFKLSLPKQASFANCKTLTPSTN